MTEYFKFIRQINFTLLVTSFAIIIFSFSPKKYNHYEAALAEIEQLMKIDFSGYENRIKKITKENFVKNANESKLISNGLHPIIDTAQVVIDGMYWFSPIPKNNATIQELYDFLKDNSHLLLFDIDSSIFLLQLDRFYKKNDERYKNEKIELIRLDKEYMWYVDDNNERQAIPRSSIMSKSPDKYDGKYMESGLSIKSTNIFHAGELHGFIKMVDSLSFHEWLFGSSKINKIRIVKEDKIEWTPSLISIWSEISQSNLTGAKEFLNQRIDAIKKDNTIEIFGLKINGILAFLSGPFLLFSILFYLNAHLKRVIELINSGIKCSYDNPSLIISKGLHGKVVSVCNIVVIPLIGLFSITIRAYEEGITILTLSSFFFLSSTFICLLILKNLNTIREKVAFEEIALVD